MSRDAPRSEVERLFGLVLACEPNERAAMLERACSNPELRREVESLVLADLGANGFLEPALNRAPALGHQIGCYRLLRKIGEGQHSSVYLAMRDDQFRQRVAIKLIRPGLDSREIVQRFHQERQILASLTHANIARLLDGGSTGAGQPYLVMEYVDGEPLDVYCQRRALSLPQRLELFGAVCQAVHFAHRNLVVHRDLKPGNILVDAEGAPKLLDFGIAKLLDPDRLGVAIEPTASAARLMTPHYASPEQVLGQTISTASDVYSLGVILYRLLTGRRPYELGAQSPREIERVVCEVMPVPPSQVLRAAGLGRLPRDLDNIVLMAMRKEPERRYSSAHELADDLRRCRERRPVLARRDTLGYRLLSFTRRNAGAVAAAAAIAICLVVGGVAATWQWRRAVGLQARAEAQHRLSEQTLQFVIEMFRVRDPAVEMSRVTARELLDRGARRLRDQAQSSPEVRAAFEHTLGVVYLDLGDYPHAAALLEDAIAARSRMPGEQLALADSLYQLGVIDAVNGRPDRAEASMRRALAIRIQLLGPDDPAVADALEHLADGHGYRVSAREAEDALLRALAIRRRAPDGLPALTADLARLAELYSVTGRHAEAERLIRGATALRSRTSDRQPCNPGDDLFFYDIALLRLREGYFAEAEHDCDAAVACLAREVGAHHADVVDMRSAQVPILREQGRYAEAEELARSSLAERRALHGEHSPMVDNALYHLAYVLFERGALVEAARFASAALEMRERTYGHQHESVAASLVLIADIHLAEGVPGEAEAAYRDALAVWRALGDSDRPSVAGALRGIAEAAVMQGRLDEARAMADQALALERSRLRAMHPDIARTLVVLAEIALRGSSAGGAAEPLLREALAIQRAALDPDHPSIARAEGLLGDALLAQHRTAEALPLLRHAAEALRIGLGDGAAEAQRAQDRLQAAELASRPAAPI